MAPIVHCVRHAQGYHNLSVENHSMPDPSLTAYGEEQCARLAHDFPYHKRIDLLVASPLRRTLYTTLHGFQPEIKRGVQIVALPEAQEVADVPCDTGSDIGVLKEEMTGKPVDLSRVHEGWNSKTGRWANRPDKLEERARETRQWLKSRKEKEIVLVTHGGFLHYFTEDWTDYNEVMGTGWANVEFRSYQFVDEKGDNASMMETKQSKELRHGTGTSSRKETAGKTWENGDFQPVQAKV